MSTAVYFSKWDSAAALAEIYAQMPFKLLAWQSGKKGSAIR